MADGDLELMAQNTLDLASILDAHREHSAEQLMSAMIRLVRQIDTSRKRIVQEMRGARRPGIIYDSMMQPNVLAARLSADTLLSVNERAILSFRDITRDDVNPMTAQATADVLAWLSIAEQTSIALRLLFQTSRLYGRAPNGKRLKSDSEDF